jgi:hypothetical protein
VELGVERLTTSIGIKIDRARAGHNGEVISSLRDIIQKHKGKKELYVQVTTGDGKKVSLKVNGEWGVRITKDLVDDLEHILGNGAVQLTGDGQKRMKRLAQQQLFKDAQADAADNASAALEAPAPADAELEMADAD